MVRTVGDYRVEEPIGTAGTARVFRGRHRSTGEIVALKWLPATDPAERDRQRREAALLAAVSHPHLIGLREVLPAGEETVLVLDHLDGGSLADLLGRRGRLAPGEVVSIVAPVAAALAYAHDEGLVHGDVTPANILLTEYGRPVLADLGVARVLGEYAGSEATPEYVDPAVARGAVPGPASDVFGLAACAFHALTGVPPWNAATASATLAVAATGSLPDLHRLAPEAPAELLDVLDRALSPDPQLRGAAAELALDVRHSCPAEPVLLATDLRGVPLHPARTGSATQAVRRPQPEGPAHAAARQPGRIRRATAAVGQALVRRRRDLVAATAVVAAIVVAVLVGSFWGGSAATAPVSGPPPIATVSGAPPTADRSGPAVDEFAVPTDVEGWAALLTVLYARRATAFGTGDPSLLTGVFAPGSDQGAADRRQIERLAADGRRIDGFVPSVLAVRSVRGRVPDVMLMVLDTFGPYAVVTMSAGRTTGQDAGVTVDPTVFSTQAGRPATAVQVGLRLTDAGWRIQSAVRTG
ncbi:MAG: serine/threonine-protein kinase [Geodermatophilaceae bacterium]